VGSSAAERSTVRLFVKTGRQATATDVVTLDGQIVSLSIDDGAILAATAAGDVHLLLQHVFMYGQVARDADGDPIVTTVEARSDACADGPCTEAMWATTTPEGEPLAALGTDNALKVISFDCEP
jgi:hypothetical protein